MKNIFVIMSLFLSSSAFAESSSVVPVASVAPATTIISPTAVAAVTATPVATLSDVEKKKLTTEFQRALANQRGALVHQEKSSMKELNSSQNMKRKKWLSDEKNARHQYFDQHMSGPERRAYVQAFTKKKQDFENSLKNEYSASKKSWAEKLIALKASQKEQEVKFNASIAQGVRPSAELWPKGN